jgi:predicted nucleic acid-binding protein
MSARAFLDTNFLIYLYSESDADKRQTACNTLDRYQCVTSLQAFNEASNTWSKKYSWNGIKIREHLDNIELVCDEVVSVSRNTLNTAISLKDRYSYSYYDCLMLASALESNSSIIFTEDMSNGQVINGTLTITNPFA